MKAVIWQGVLLFCLINIGFVQSGDASYLDFDNLPDTNFSCVGKVIGGYYADLETNCQMFHVCTIGQLDEPMDIRFLCLNGTVFDQETRVCERVDEVDCTKSERFYHLNLELYGNTAPPILEEPDNTEPPIISTSTTTTPRSTTLRTTRTTYYTTPQPSQTAPTTHSTPKVITSNQFPVHSGPDIRFNPEEINIRLTPGSPPIIKSNSGIKTPSVSYQQQTFNGGDSRITVTTHTTLYKDDSHGRTSQKSVLSSTTQKPKSLVSYGLTHSNHKPHYQHPSTFDYTSYQQTENSDVDYHTDLPSSEYYDNDHDSGYGSHMSYQSSIKNPLMQIFSVASTTKRNEHNKVPTYRSSTAFPSIKTHEPTIPKYNYQRTEKPPSVQLPLPIFPTLPPLTFSSPAPFSLTRHFESKRSNDQQQRPRIIVSASASVSDASGRRLNYSLGTIGTSHILGKAPHSYDEYKEDDVGLDPFYHDVPRVKNSRRKRAITQVQDNKELREELENTAQEEIDSKETQTELGLNTTPWTIPEYVDDNYEPLTYNDTKAQKENNTEAELSKFTTKPGNTDYEYYYEYIDDNYEPSTYNKSKSNNTTISVSDLITASYSNELQEKETTLEVNTVTEPIQDTTTTEIPTTEEPLTTTHHFTSQVQSNSTYVYEVDSSTPITTTIEPTTLTTQETTTDFSKTTYYPDSVTTTTDFPKISTSDYLEMTTELPTTTTEPSTITSTTNIPTTELMQITTTDYPELIDQTTKSVDPTTAVLRTEMFDAPSVPSQTTSRNKYSFKTREPSYRRNSITKPTPKHRFSSPSIRMSPSVLKIGNKLVEIESVKPIEHLVKHINADSVHFTTTLYDEPITEAPILKSANPTEPKITKTGSTLSTTPLIKTFNTQRRFSYDNTKTFNCLGKQMNTFYEDPRDCRLFHYCTPGYTSTQVLDMKFVCDFGTYFDSDKLICTRFKPQRCKTFLKQV